MSKTYRVIFLLIATIGNAYAAGHRNTVELFVQAFNEKNIEQMLALSAPNMHWMSISGKSISVETSSVEQFRQAMTEYFESIPSARSTILSFHTSGQFVYSLEEAFWQSGEALKSQCSMAIYEFADDKIQYVWYFPSHNCK